MQNMVLRGLTRILVVRKLGELFTKVLLFNCDLSFIFIESRVFIVISFTNDCLQYMSAMIHPGGGRNDVPQRFKRHFITFNCTIPTDDAIDHIFGTIAQVNKETTKIKHFHFLLKGHFNANRGFSDDVANLMQLLVPMTRKMWKITKEKMLPTPSKFHYVFNLRDLSRIWLGMIGVTSQVCMNILSKLHLFVSLS